LYDPLASERSKQVSIAERRYGIHDRAIRVESVANARRQMVSHAGRDKRIIDRVAPQHRHRHDGDQQAQYSAPDL
jgi:hypothetical protein